MAHRKHGHRKRDKKLMVAKTETNKARRAARIKRRPQGRAAKVRQINKNKWCKETKLLIDQQSQGLWPTDEQKAKAWKYSKVKRPQHPRRLPNPKFFKVPLFETAISHSNSSAIAVATVIRNSGLELKIINKYPGFMLQPR